MPLDRHPREVIRRKLSGEYRSDIIRSLASTDVQKSAVNNPGSAKEDRKSRRGDETRSVHGISLCVQLNLSNLPSIRQDPDPCGNLGAATPKMESAWVDGAIL